MKLQVKERSESEVSYSNNGSGDKEKEKETSRKNLLDREIDEHDDIYILDHHEGKFQQQAGEILKDKDRWKMIEQQRKTNRQKLETSFYKYL